MARYSELVGKRVEAHYRAGDLQLSTIGTLASDTGKTIFVQERFASGGNVLSETDHLLRHILCSQISR